MLLSKRLKFMQNIAITEENESVKLVNCKQSNSNKTKAISPVIVKFKEKG